MKKTSKRYSTEMTHEENFPVSESLPASLGRVRRNGMILIGTFILLATIWGGFVPIPQAVLAHGTLRATRPPVDIHYPNDGVLEEVRVSEGASVRRGETLAVMDTTELKLRRESARRLLLSLRLERLRLQSDLNGSPDLTLNDDMAAEVNSLKMSNALALEQEQLRLSRKIYELQNNNFEARFKRLNEKTDQLTKRLALETEQILSAQIAAESYEALHASGRIKATDLEKVRQTYLSLRANAAETDAELAQTQMALNDAMHEFDQIPTKRRTKRTSRLTAINRLILEQELILKRSMLEIRSARIRSPLDGVVVDLKYDSPSTNVPRNESLMTITPKSSGTFVEIQIKPKDIDQISLGVNASIILPSDSKGNVETISASVVRVSSDVVKSHTVEPLHFTAALDFDPEALEAAGRTKDNEPLLRLGMPVNARIEIGSQTLFEYLFEPLNRTITHAFAE